MTISVMNLLIYLSEGTNWYHQFSINSKTTIFCVLVNTNVDKLFILNALIDLFLYGVHYFYYSDVLFFISLWYTCILLLWSKKNSCVFTIPNRREMLSLSRKMFEPLFCTCIIPVIVLRSLIFHFDWYV